MQNKITITSPALTISGAWAPFQVRAASLALTIMALVLCTDMLSGALRYYLSQVGLDFLIYLPKAACLFFVVHEIMRKPLERAFFYMLLFLFLFAGIGFIHQTGFAAQLFAIFLISPFLFGAVSVRYIIERENAFVVLLAVVFFVTALGVVLDVYLDLPWSGYVYQLAGSEIEGSREWSTFGLERVSGFARMSTSAAFYLVCGALFLYSYFRSRWSKLMVLLVAFPTVFATTNKAGIGGLVLGFAALMISRVPRLLKVSVYGLAAMTAFLPFSTVVRSYQVDLSDPVSVALLASFEDRLINTWPNFLAEVAKFGNPAIGVGFGGVGSAVKYFSHGSQVSLAVADNFALYLYGCFGLVSVVILLYFAHVAVTLFASRERLARSLAPVMVALLAASLTTDVIEAQVFALILGIAIVFSHKITVPIH
ncbi:MAG TPA: hypothetical protein VI298_12540 [Geobacteraceae bacterium]